MSTTTEELSFAQRTCLRRLARGESPGDLAEALGALYLAQLVEDGPDGPRITDLGRRYLEHLDQPPPTRKTERPALESRPLPDGWGASSLDGRLGSLHTLCGAFVLIPLDVSDARLQKLEEDARRLLAGIDWVRHERAVRAQTTEVRP